MQELLKSRFWRKMSPYPHMNVVSIQHKKEGNKQIYKHFRCIQGCMSYWREIGSMREVLSWYSCCFIRKKMKISNFHQVHAAPGSRWVSSFGLRSSTALLGALWLVSSWPLKRVGLVPKIGNWAILYDKITKGILIWWQMFSRIFPMDTMEFLINIAYILSWWSKYQSFDLLRSDLY